MLRSASKYIAIFRIELRNLTAYTWDFLLSNLTIILFFYVLIQVWEVTVSADAVSAIPGETFDWTQLISSMELHWEVLLVALLNFRFIYPSERHLIPRWVMDELLERLHAQMEMPSAGKRVCRGRIFSPRDYMIDISEWGFSEAVGNLEEDYATKF